MDVVTQEQMKKSFRIVYDFLNDHANVLQTLDDYQLLAGDLAEKMAEYHDPLTCRLLSGVCDFICAESKRVTR